jgi:acyl dehydratase
MDPTKQKVNAMKDKALHGLLVLLSLIIVFAAGGGRRAGLNLVIQQIRVIGPRQ